jgi:hypothetical protein
LHFFHFGFEDGDAGGQPLPEVLGGFIYRRRFALQDGSFVGFPFGAPVSPDFVGATDSCHERQHDGF